MKISPFAPEHFPDLPAIDGFVMATAEAGVRYRGRTDVWVLIADAGTTLAGVYTQNQCPGAPVDWSRKALGVKTDGPRAVIVNSGTANVFSGQAGRDAVVQTADGIADVFGVEASAVQIASTGVIGEALDASKLIAQFPDMKARLRAEGWEDAANAIMTTDTHAKGASARATVGGKIVTINGIAKGSGMIAPDMATMLAYVATDAAIPEGRLQAMLCAHVGPTFNAITVDSDTSTSDTVLLLASGAAGNAMDADFTDFERALGELMEDLALQVVKDGEGISKFVTVNVTGAVSDVSAKRVAMSVANSPLVKTAIAGADANWGRIVMAVGKADEPAERDKLTIRLGPLTLATSGQPDANYQDADGAAYMAGSEIEIGIDLGLGSGAARVYTCDLTHAYIDINADYRS